MLKGVLCPEASPQLTLRPFSRKKRSFGVTFLRAFLYPELTLLDEKRTQMFELTNPHRHWGCRLNDRITWNGFRAVMLQNELLQIVILLDKGAEIIQFLFKPLDLDFLWRAENPLRDPSHFVPTGDSPVTPFFDHWSGGWFEVVPNGGPGCEYKGAPLGFFAETINVPWEYRILEDRPERVSLGLWVKTYRTP